ncbi:MAG: sugar ABC transporter ATP-binding protein [Gammaproteobacteria bacterium]|nr:sugar ABC transporter ATP-binding protein [Gammaproteobacteria bacterium]
MTPSATPANAAEPGNRERRPPAIAATGICKSYATEVLRNVDLRIAPGTIHGLVGENGAGKSTLAKIMVGLEQSDAGSLSLAGAPYQPRSAAESLKAGVALCAQELSLIDDLSIADNLLLPTSSAQARIRRKAADERALQALALVGLAHASPATRVGRLSLAEKQLVELARALATGASLLVLDEPTSALTVPQSQRLHEVLREQANAGVAVIYISHRLGDVLDLCDQISVLRDGEVRLTRPSGELSEAALIREMAGVDADFEASERGPVAAMPVHLSVHDLRTAALPHPISFECRRGEILGIAGLAGSGRTELLRAIFGLDKRLGGAVRLDVGGTSVELKGTKQAIRCGVGLVAEDRASEGVFQDQGLAFNVTVAGLRRIANRTGRLIRSREASAVAGLVRELRVKSDGIHQPMRTLSGGNQQKAMLGRWLHCDAQLLLLDEPTRGVDVAAKLAIHEELVRLRDAGRSIVAVSSELDELASLCDRIIVLSNRKLVREFQRSELCQEDVLAAAFSEYA